MFCSKCGAKAVADAKFCSSCGGALNQVSPTNETPPAQKVAAKTSDGFFTKLSRGDYGLSRTYWLYGVLVGIIVNIVSYTIESIRALSVGELVILMLAYIAYAIPLTMGIWRAAGKYQGQKIWAVLARIAVVLGVIILVGGLLAVLHLLGRA